MVKSKIMSYHGATTNKRERTNMAELVNNYSPCSVSIILHLKHDYISDTASRIEVYKLHLKCKEKGFEMQR